MKTTAAVLLIALLMTSLLYLPLIALRSYGVQLPVQDNFNDYVYISGIVPLIGHTGTDSLGGLPAVYQNASYIYSSTAYSSRFPNCVQACSVRGSAFSDNLKNEISVIVGAANVGTVAEVSGALNNGMVVSGTCTANSNPNPKNLSPCIEFQFVLSGTIFSKGNGSSTSGNDVANASYSYAVTDYSNGHSIPGSGYYATACTGYRTNCNAYLSFLDIGQDSGTIFMSQSIASGDVVSWMVSLGLSAVARCDSSCSANASAVAVVKIFNLDPLHMTFGPTAAEQIPSEMPSSIAVSSSLSPASATPASSVSDTVNVKNTGNSSINGLTLTGSLEGALTCPQTSLAAGASEQCSATFTAPAVTGSYVDYIDAVGTNSTSRYGLLGGSNSNLVVSTSGGTTTSIGSTSSSGSLTQSSTLNSMTSTQNSSSSGGVSLYIYATIGVLILVVVVEGALLFRRKS